MLLYLLHTIIQSSSSSSSVVVVCSIIVLYSSANIIYYYWQPPFISDTLRYQSPDICGFVFIALQLLDPCTAEPWRLSFHRRQSIGQSFRLSYWHKEKIMFCTLSARGYPNHYCLLPTDHFCYTSCVSLKKLVLRTLCWSSANSMNMLSVNMWQE